MKIWGHRCDENPKGWGRRSDTPFDIAIVGLSLVVISVGVTIGMVIGVCGFASIAFPGVCYFLAPLVL